MSKTLKIILIIISALVVFIVLPIIVTGLFFFGVTKEVVDTFGSAYGDEDIMEYVKKTHGIEVEVTENKGREPSSFFGMVMNDARVRTVEDNPLEFTVFISISGKIIGDDYEDVRERKKLSDTLQASAGYQQLESLGFLNIHFGNDESDPAILMDLPQGLTFADEATAQMLFDALPILIEWQKQAAEQKIDYDIVDLHGLKMDLNLNYDSWEDLRNKLAAGNIHYFSYQFIEEDMKKIQTIEEELYKLGFNQDDSSFELTCYEMEVYNECEAYEYTLFPYDYNKSDFRYDDQIDKENLFNAIQVLRDLDLPFQKIIVNSVYVPREQENQQFSKEELEKEDEYVRFYKTGVTITNIEEITSADDIYFEYDY